MTNHRWDPCNESVKAGCALKRTLCFPNETLMLTEISVFLKKDGP